MSKPLKSIKFPGMDETYEIPVVDNTLSISGAAADAKVVRNEIEKKTNSEDFIKLANSNIFNKNPSFEEEDSFPKSGFGFVVGGDGYSVYIPINGGDKYILSFESSPYSGAGVGVQLALECYDFEKNIVKNGSSIESNKFFGFVNRVTGNINSTTLLGKEYPEGGYREIAFEKNVSYIRFIINNKTSAVINERIPIGWKLIHNIPSYEYALNYKYEPPKNYYASNNLFVKSESSTKKDVYLGKNKNGVKLNGWYLSSNGIPVSLVSSTGIDSTSSPIPVKEGATYWKTNGTTFNIFDKDDILIGNIDMGKRICIIPKGASFVRIGFPSTRINEIQLVEGDKEISYDEGAYKVPGYSSQNHPRVTKVLDRNGLSFDFSEKYIKDIAFEANKYASKNKCTFIFITDTHTHALHTYVEGIVAEMTKLVNCTCVLHGGDIIDGLSDKNNELYILSELNRNMLECKCPILYTKGNHDDNCLYARTKNKNIEDYITNMELFVRTNKFQKNIANVQDNMCMFYDDNDAKIRFIVLNSFDNPETDTGGIRDEDARTIQVSEKQITWIKNEALNLSAKSTPSEWSIIFLSHRTVSFRIKEILNAFHNGTGSFESQGPGNIIAEFIGDDHFDSVKLNEYSDFPLTSITGLNASTAQDNVGSATNDNTILYPPIKTFGTENETAFDIVTVDKENYLIYLTRYGARSYTYNTSTQKFDLIATRTRIVNYKNGTYTKLI